MGRTITAVLAGYLIMAGFIMVTFTVAFVLLGSERAFRQGSYDVSTLWILVSFVLGLAAALLGGFVCAALARSRRAIPALMVLVIVLGVALAVPAALSDPGPSAVRDGPVGNREAMEHSRQPGWVVLATPLMGALGVWLGGRLRWAGGS